MNADNFDWTSLYASAQARLKPSAIREILKVTRRPGIVSFAGGVPDPKLFPYQELDKCIQSVTKNLAVTAYQYGITQGCEELLAEISKLACSLGRPTENANLLITNGSQQGLDIIGRLFLNEGDPIIVTRPCYLGALQAFAPTNPKFFEVNCDDEGPILDELKAALKSKPKFLYLVPAFQNPTGKSISLERGKQILELCRAAKVPVIEDAAYEGLYFEDRPISLRALEAEWLAANSLSYSQSGNVVYLGTFSKVIAPGFRIGWMEAPVEVANSAVVLKQGSDLHSSSFNQLVIAQFLKDHAKEYWVGLRKAYSRKRDVMLSLVESILGPHAASYSKPKGGLFVWVETKRKIDFTELLKDAVEKESIAFVPGAPFFASDPIINSLRISFATASEEEMASGIAKLGKLIAAAPDSG